jgi:hypothetical protein
MEIPMFIFIGILYIVPITVVGVGGWYIWRRKEVIVVSMGERIKRVKNNMNTARKDRIERKVKKAEEVAGWEKRLTVSTVSIAPNRNSGFMETGSYSAITEEESEENIKKMAISGAAYFPTYNEIIRNTGAESSYEQKLGGVIDTLEKIEWDGPLTEKSIAALRREAQILEEIEVKKYLKKMGESI